MWKENVQKELEDNFRKKLKVQPTGQSITEFPTDESLVKMPNEGLGQLFNVEDIEKKIKISKLSKERRTIISISRKNKYNNRLLL